MFFLVETQADNLGAVKSPVQFPPALPTSAHSLETNPRAFDEHKFTQLCSKGSHTSSHSPFHCPCFSLWSFSSLLGLEFDGAASSNSKFSSLSPLNPAQTLPSLHLLCTHSLHYNLIPLVLSLLPQEEGILCSPHAPKELEQSHHHHHSPFFGKFYQHHLFLFLSSSHEFQVLSAVLELSCR